MMNTNQLHESHLIKRSSNGEIKHREFPKSFGSIVNSNGTTKPLTQKQAKILFEKIEDGDFDGVIDVEIEFKTEKQGLRLARSFKNLAKNPAVKLNVKFINKINGCKNNN